ncbi:hypothetical protein [Streptomyces phaeochromogenes]
MKRDRATSLPQEMLARLDAGAWPASLVEEVHVFAPYPREVLELVDVDVAVTHGTDEAFTQEVVGALLSGSDLMASKKRALRDRRCGIQFNQNAALAEASSELTLLWKRGDMLATALDWLALAPDAQAGRAPRDDMIE